METEIAINVGWRVQQILRDKVDVMETFPASQVSGYIKETFGISIKATPHLNRFNCLKPISKGSFGKSGLYRSSNTYLKRAEPGKVCDDCKAEASCIIKHVKMAKQFGLAQPI